MALLDRLATVRNRAGEAEVYVIDYGAYVDLIHTKSEPLGTLPFDGGDCGPLGELLSRAVLDNLYKFVVPAIAGPARLVPLQVLSAPELSADALRVAASRGRLKAARGADGTWRTSRAWVDEYMASRSRRGRRAS